MKKTRNRYSEFVGKLNSLPEDYGSREIRELKHGEARKYEEMKKIKSFKEVSWRYDW